MKVSLNTIKYINQVYGCSEDPYAYGVDDIVRRIGHQLGAVEDVIRTGGKYEGIVVAKVISCQKHPDADKLNVCMIDDGGVTENVERGNGGMIQVVCGAPNVAAGQLVAWLPPGVVVPSTLVHEPFTLERREIRGKMSNGMLGSPSELDLADDHQGILVIDPNDVGEELSVPGTPFGKLYGADDVIIDCENKMFTHRPDCFGMLGVAREIAGIFGEAYHSPDWYVHALQQESDDELALEVGVQIPELVPRFMVRAMSNVTVGPSPMWLQAFLHRIGVKSINYIVDLTNYFMLVTGQPLHAFDYDKVAALSGGDGAVVQARLAEEGEEITLLGGKIISLSSSDMVIATDSMPIALAGVMGGAATEVDENTRNIIIECANFDMYAIRRTSMRHGLFTDAVTRFNKGQSPLQNVSVLGKIIDEIQKTTDARVASPLFDIATFNVDGDNLNRVQTTVAFINERLGSELSAQDIKRMLENVEFVVAIEDNDTSLLITAPFWRMDIAIAEDIVEEIGRLNGYDQLPVVLPLRNSKPAPKNSLREFKQRLRSRLAALGANEVLSYSFVHGKLLTASGTDPEQWAYHLRNAISPDLQYYRTSLMPSLLAKVHQNIKSQAGTADNQFGLFEIGKAHVKGQQSKDGLPTEFQRLSFVFAADSKTAEQYDGSAYFQAKLYLDELTHHALRFEPIEDFSFPINSVYAPGRSAVVLLNDEAVGVIGEFAPRTKQALRLPDFSAGFELDIIRLYRELNEPKYAPLSNFPPSSQDITLEIDQTVSWHEVHALVAAEIAVAAAEADSAFSIKPLDIFQPDGTDKKRYSFRVTLTNFQRTLTTDNVSSVLAHVEAAAAKSLKALRT